MKTMTDQERLTIYTGYKVYSSNEAYIGRVRNSVLWDDTLGKDLWIAPTPIIGTDFPVLIRIVHSLRHSNPGRVILSVDWVTVLWLASKRFDEFDAGPFRYAPNPSDVTDLGERAILEIRQARERADAFEAKYGPFSPEEQKIHVMTMQQRIDQIQQEYERALATVLEA